MTRSMRSKEEAHDYRYFPDPDLLPLELGEDYIEALRATLPELPDARKRRYVEALGLSAYDAAVLVAEKETADYFEAAAAGRDPKLAANWVTVELFGALHKVGRTVADSPVSARALSELLGLIADGTVSGRIAKTVFEEMFASGRGAAAIVEEKGLVQVTDRDAIAALVDSVLAENGDRVAEYRAGKEKLLGFFVGQVMRKSEGKANPRLVNELLKSKLAG